VLRFPWHDVSCVGAIEFHVRSSDWYAHQHHSDARYMQVILHVVLICDHPSPALCQDGRAIPMCSLNDLAPPRRSYLAAAWPCQQVMRQLDEQERGRMLRQAGLLRFEQKTHAFVELLHKSYPQDPLQGPFSACDLCLITALAEGLGYGRDRAFFRAAGRHLLGLGRDLPEPLGRTMDPPPLDKGRLRVLRKLVEQWRVDSAWQTLREIVSMQHSSDRLDRLRAVFYGLGTARADILICNVVLPFAMAVALIEQDSSLAEQAQALVDGGVDLLVLETFFALDEAIWAAEGARGVTDLPLVASFSFDQGTHTMMGLSPSDVVAAVEPLGVEREAHTSGRMAAREGHAVPDSLTPDRFVFGVTSEAVVALLRRSLGLS